MNPVKHEVHEQRNLHVAEVAARPVSDQAWQQFAHAETIEEFCGSWLIIQSHAIGGVSDGVVILQKPGNSSFAPIAFYPDNGADRGHLAAASEQALQEGRGVVQPIEQADPDARGPRYQLAYPIRLDGQMRGVVSVEIDWRAEPQLQAAMRDLQWGSGWLEVLLRRHSDPKEAARLKRKLALDLVSTLLEQSGLRSSTAAFTTELATQLGCDRATLGIVKGKRVRVTAVSHSANFDRRANLLRAVEEAMEEAVDQRATVVCPPDRNGPPIVAHAHAVLLRESEAGSAVTFPLVNGDRVVGALTLERREGYLFDLTSLEICEAIASVVGPIVDLKRESEESLPVHAWESTAALWRKLTGEGHPGLKLTAIGVIVVALFFAFASGDYRISANSTVEGVVQRAVAAPFDGYVKEAPLRAGQTVTAGQVIARLDDRDLVLERVKLASQRDQYDKQYREAMANHDRAQTEIVGAQIAQADAQIALTEEQLQRVTLTSPLDGLIVSGDLSQSLGSPVQQGQVLFEIAPLDGYRVALQVDERDIGEVSVGLKGDLMVASMPRERFAFTVTSITPINTAKDGRNFFKVEARLDDVNARLRPGMEGVGKIYVDERKLVWIWTHSLTDWLRMFIWSWMP
jgi:biotin carboxyl carrier protein